MANKLTTAQRNLIIEALNLDKAANYSRLEYYLKQIISGRDVSFETRASDPFVVSSGEAWEIIVEWSKAEGSLPVGDRASRWNAKSRATKLLNYLETNISGKAAEAAANYQLILDQASETAPPVSPPKNTQEVNLKKIFELRRLQTDILQAGIVGKIYTNLEKSKILEGIPIESRTRVLQMFAAANQNFRINSKDPTQNFTPEKIHQLLLHTPGVSNVNQIMRLFYSKSAQRDFETLTETINSTIQEHYRGDESRYQLDMSALRSVSSTSPGLNSVEYLVNSLNITSTPKERAALIKSIRTQIIASASNGRHLRGDKIIQSAIRSAGFPEISIDYFKSLAPYVEEIEIKERHLLLGANLSDHDSRLLATSGLAGELGVGLETPWLKQNDLDAAIFKLTSNKDPSSLQTAFDTEVAKGDKADLARLADLINLMGKHADYRVYHATVGGSLGYKLQEVLSKGVGNYFAVKEPVDKFTQKIWGGVTSIDDFIHYPQRKLADWVEKITEKYPLLNPGAYIANRLVKYQTSIALNIHRWAIGVSASSWFGKSGFAGHIADFTEGFIKHEANWGGATIFFTQRKIGNVLDWSTKLISKGKHETFTSFKVSIAKTTWGGFKKIAPGLAAKMAASELGKVVFSFLAGELTLGASLAIQAGWEALKIGATKIWSFAKKIFNGDVNDLGGVGTMALGSLFLFVNTILGGIPVAIIIGLGLLKEALRFLWNGFLALLALAALVSVIATTFIVVIWSGLITPTFNLDSGFSQLAANILCDPSGNPTMPGVETGTTSTVTGGKPTLAKAVCLAKYLNGCYGQSVTNSNVSRGLSCLATYAISPAAISEITNSATSFTYLQCVGFVKAVVAWAGTSISSHNACGYVDDPRFVSGLSGAKPGDAIVFRSSSTCSDGAPGHIGILLEDAGATVCLVDANQVCSGCVSERNCLPKTNVAGYLRL